MKRRELIKAIKAAKAVYAFSPIIRNDGAYLKIEKRFILDMLATSADEIVDYAADMQSDGSLYLA